MRGKMSTAMNNGAIQIAPFSIEGLSIIAVN